MKIPILEFIHVFSISDFENYYKNRFLFLFSILIKLFDHEIVNCEIIHDVSMLIYILATSKQLPHRRPEKKPKSWLFSNVRRKKSQNSGLLSNFRRIIFKIGENVSFNRVTPPRLSEIVIAQLQCVQQVSITLVF